MKESVIELIETKNIDVNDFVDAHDLYEALDYDGSLHEIIDSNIDIYYYDLRKWAVDNYNYVEDAVDEGLVDTSNFDFHKAIQSGQYVQLREEMSEIVEAIFSETQEAA